MDYRRIHARRRDDVDEAMLRALVDEQARLEHRLGGARKEIAGIQQVIELHQERIAEVIRQAEEWEKDLEQIAHQQQEIEADHQHRSLKSA